MPYVVTEPAGQDIDEIIRTIALDDPGAARRMGLRFVQTFELLAPRREWAERSGPGAA